jgi:hypothetical protein
VHERRLESLDALTTMLALSLPIAVELLARRTLARADSRCPANTVLTTRQLAALRHISHRPLPKKPTVQHALWCIAGLGGHIKNNGAPAGRSSRSGSAWAAEQASRRGLISLGPLRSPARG